LHPHLLTCYVYHVPLLSVSNKEKKEGGGGGAKRDATEEGKGGEKKKRKANDGMVVYNGNTKVASV